MHKRTTLTPAQPIAAKAVETNQAAAVSPTSINFESPVAADLLNLQQTIGNRAINRLIQRKLTVGAADDPQEAEADAVANRVMSGAALAQRAVSEDDDLLQGKREAQRQSIEEEEEPLQAKREVQRVQGKENTTGLPDALKTGIENLSGYSMDNVKVHYNSSKPAQLNALAYAQDTDIHIAPGQEQHLSHEAWHVVQQKTGRTDPMPETLAQTGPGDGATLQTKRDAQRSETDMTDSFDAGPDIEGRIHARTGSGNPLPGETQNFMESRIGADFSNVRVHTDTEATQISRDISAQAFTYGTDIYFASGKYDPGSDSGKHLLAHELAHTVQQGAARQVSAKRHVQRHNAPVAPKTLVPTPIAGDKAKWKVADILPESDLKKLQENLIALIPADAKPTPAERVAALKFVDHEQPTDMPSGYEGVAAKVESDGTVHFNNSFDDYFETNGSVKANKVKSTIVHEAMHAISANHTGLQDYSDLIQQGSIQQSPDEALTEYFSIEIYKSVFGMTAQDYETGYWVPNSQRIAAAPDPSTKQAALQQQLPAGWTGQMVEIIKSVLGIGDDKLKSLYFKNPAEFAELLEGKRDEIKSRWSVLMGKQTLEGSSVLTVDYKESLLDEVIQQKAEAIRAQDTADKRIEIVKTELVARGVPNIANSKTTPYSDPLITRKVKALLNL